MNTELVERVDMAQAQGRYGMSRAGLNNRLAAVRDSLNLETIKEGGKGWLSGELLAIMDALHAHKERGGTQEEFLAAQVRERSGGGTMAIERPRAALAKAERGGVHHQGRCPNAPQPGGAEGLALVVEAVAERVAERLVPRDPLAGLRALKEAAAEGWLLSSSQVGELIGVLPRGKQFERHGFVFVRSGNVGAQSGWRVHKPSSTN